MGLWVQSCLLLGGHREEREREETIIGHVGQDNDRFGGKALPTQFWKLKFGVRRFLVLRNSEFEASSKSTCATLLPSFPSLSQVVKNPQTHPEASSLAEGTGGGG